jgi:hypothetical protein
MLISPMFRTLNFQVTGFGLARDMREPIHLIYVLFRGFNLQGTGPIHIASERNAGYRYIQ